MKKLRLKTTLLSLLFLSSIALSAQNSTSADCPNYGKKGRSMHNSVNKAERMATYLDLTDEQKEKFESMHLNHQKKVLPFQNEMGEKRAKMKTLSSAENADMKAIYSLIDEMSVIKTKMAKMKAAHKQEIRKLLTEEQRIKFDSHTDRRGQRGYGHRGRS